MEKIRAISRNLIKRFKAFGNWQRLGQRVAIGSTYPKKKNLKIQTQWALAKCFCFVLLGGDFSGPCNVLIQGRFVLNLSFSLLHFSNSRFLSFADWVRNERAIEQLIIIYQTRSGNRRRKRFDRKDFLNCNRSKAQKPNTTKQNQQNKLLT